MQYYVACIFSKEIILFECSYISFTSGSNGRVSSVSIGSLCEQSFVLRLVLKLQSFSLVKILGIAIDIRALCNT